MIPVKIPMAVEQIDKSGCYKKKITIILFYSIKEMIINKSIYYRE